MDNAAQERARRQYDGLRRNLGPISKLHAGHAVSGHQKIDNLTNNNRKVLLFLGFSLHRSAIQGTVCLSSRALDSWSFAAIEQPELYSGLICDATHDTVQRIDLAYKVPLTQSTNGRIAGHDANIRSGQSHQRRGYAHTGRRMGSLSTRMTGTDNDDIKI